MRNFSCVILALVFAVTLQLCSCDTNEGSIVNEINDNVTISHQQPKPPMFTTGNELWDGLIRDCLKKPTFSCIQKNVFTFLDSTLGLKDINVTSRVHLTQNDVDYTLPEQPNDDENEIFSEGRGKIENAC